MESLYLSEPLPRVIDLTSEDEVMVSSVNVVGLPQHIMNVWTSDQRIFLFFLRRRYENSWEDSAILFNTAFDSDLRGRGFIHGLLARTLQAQFRDGPRYRKEDFRRVVTTPFEKLFDEFDATNRSVKQAALDQGITLVPKDEDTWPKSYHNPMKKRPSVTSPFSDPMNASTHQDTRPAKVQKGHHQFSLATSTHKQIPTTPSARAPQIIPLPTPPKTLSPSSPSSSSSRLVHGIRKSNTPRGIDDILGGLQSHGNHIIMLRTPSSANISNIDGVPFILFRVWDETSHGLNTSHGFASGLHLNTSFLAEDDEGFLQYAEDHIWKRPLPSPFVSLTASFPSALKKAIEKAAGPARVTANSIDDKNITIAILDARAVAMNTRLYHANRTVGVLANQRRLPRRYFARFEFWAWQRADGIIGQTTLADFEAWRARDNCLGLLFRTYDLSRLSVNTFRKWCGKSNVTIDEELGHSIATLAKLFKPTTTFYDPFLKDFVRTIVQNLDLANDLDSWLHDAAFCRALQATLQGSTTASSQSVSLRSPESDEICHESRRNKSKNETQKVSAAHRRERVREWSTSSSLFQDLADVMNTNTALEEEPLAGLHDSKDDDGWAAITASEINGDFIDVDDDIEAEELIATPTTDVAADDLPYRFARLSTPATPSPDRPEAYTSTMIDGDEDLDSPSTDMEAASLLAQFRCPATTLATSFSSLKHATSFKTALTTPPLSRSLSQAMLRSPYESAVAPRLQARLDNSSSPLAHRVQQVETRRAFQALVEENPTTIASAALHRAISGGPTHPQPASKKRQYTVITAADREAAMDELS